MVLVARPLSLSALLLALPTSPSAAAQCSTPDAFEDNDTCGTAAALPPDGGYSLWLEGEHSAGGAEDDYFRLTIPPGETLEVEASSYPFEPGTVQIYDASCSVLLATQSFPALVRTVNLDAAPKELVVRVTPSFPIGCESYEMVTASFFDQCATLGDDAFEDGDSLATATPLPPGFHGGLTVFHEDEDWYLVTARVGDLVDVTIQSHMTGVHAPPARARFVDTVTGDALGNWFSDATASTFNLTGVDRIALQVVAPSPYDCNAYDLQVGVTGTPCSLADDELEGADEQIDAEELPPGYYPNLNLHFEDPDYYDVTLQPGESMAVEATWDLELSQLYFRVIYAANWETPDVAPGRIRTIHRNYSTVPRTYVLHAAQSYDGWNPDAPCVRYALRLERENIGTTYCDAAPNSTGAVGTLVALGSARVADDRLALSMGGMPGGQYGLVFYGTTQISVPFGDGVRCVGGQTRRLTQPTWMGYGQMRLWVDFDAPAAAGLTPGSTVHFQGWHREPGGSFNLTEALSLTIE